MPQKAAHEHGAVEASKQGLLVVKLSKNDNDASVAAAWMPAPDRTISTARKGERPVSHDYHALASDLLPQDTQLWVAIEKRVLRPPEELDRYYVEFPSGIRLKDESRGNDETSM